MLHVGSMHEGGDLVSNENEKFLELWGTAEANTNIPSYELSDFLRAPERTDDFFESFVLRDVGPFRYAYYSSIAGNPNVSQKVIDILATRAGHRWEYRSINGFYERQIAKLGLAISENNYPLEILDGRAFGSPEEIFLVYGALRYMAEDLWHDLGSAKIWQLEYRADEADGDSFGPARLSSSGTEYLLSPGYFCKWIEKKPTVDIDWVVGDSAALWEQHVESDGSLIWAEEFSSDYSKDYCKAAVLVSGIANGEIVSFDRERVQRLLGELYSDNEDYATIEFEFVDFPSTGLRFKDLNSEAQVSLVNNLVFAHENDVFTKSMKLAVHILHLIATHPKTCSEALGVIEEHSDQDISAISMKYRKMVTDGEQI